MKSKKRIEKGGLFLFLIFLILAVTAVILVFALQTDPVAEVLKTDQLIKILVVLENDNKVVFGDILMYYPVSRKGALFDIAGNIGSIYSSLGRVDRIDAVYTEKGMDVYKREIEKLTGITIPFSIVIKLDEFAELVDLLGGCKVFIPYPVDEITDENHFLLPSGSVSLDGDKVRTYLEYQLPEEAVSDIQERKQNIMVAFLDAINRNRSTMFNKSNFKLYASKMDSNIDNDALFQLLSQISYIDAERITPQNITGSLRSVDGQTLLFPYYDGDLIKDIAKQTMSTLVSSSETMHNRIYVLEIQNGTDVQGLARNTAALLQNVGYDVLSTVNADRNDYEKTIIINHIGNDDVAKSLGDFIRCTNITVDEIKPEAAGAEAFSQVDFTIILGEDFDGRYVH